MNAPVVSTALSSRSVCGTTAAAAHSSAASPFSLAAAGVSSLPALSAAAPAYPSPAPAVSGVFTDTAAAHTGEARYNTTATLSLTAASHATETAAVLQQQPHELEWQQEHVEEQQLLRKEEASTVVLESTSTSTVVCNSSQRATCSTTGRAQYLRGKKYSFSSIGSSVGGEIPAAAGGGEGVAAGAGQCEGGSDCSTRSCASGRVLQTKEAANSSGDERNFRNSSRTRRPHVSTSTADEEGRDSVKKIHCGNTSGSQGKQHRIFKGRSSTDRNNSEGCVSKLSEAEGGERRHLQRTSRSGRRDRRDHSTRRRDRVAQGKPQQQENKSESNSSSGARAEEREVPEEGTATARHSQQGHGRESGDYSRVRRGEISVLQEDVTFSEAESIVLPAFVTSRGATRTAVVADASEPAAIAAFCATSTVSASVVALDQRGVAAGLAAAAAEGKRCGTVVETELVEETYHVATSSKRAALRGELAAVVGTRSQTSTESSAHSFSSKSLGHRGSARREEGLGPAKLPSAACYYSGEHQEVLKWSTLGLPSAHSVVSLPSATGTSYNVKRSNIAAATEKPRGCFERTSWEEGWPEEEQERDYGEAANSAAPNGRDSRRDTLATTTAAERARGVLAASASNSGASDLPLAASEGLDVGAAAAAADSTRHHYVRDSRGAGVPFASSASSAERGRAAAPSRGKGGAVAREGTGEGVGLVVASSGVCGGGRGVAEAGAAAGGRRLQDEGAAAAPSGDSDLQLADANYRRSGGGVGAGGAAGSNCCWSSSLLGSCVSEMAAGGERGCPGGMLLCPAPGGGAKAGGGDVKTAGCVGTMRGNDFRYNSRNAGTVNMGRAATVMNRPTRVEAGRQRFLILDSPSDENLPAYIDEMKAFNVTHLVRTCEATYDDALVRQAGICTHEWIFPDGEPPPEEVIDEWLALCNSVAAQQRAAAIAVHCVAGLGRAPVLVAVALIEKGMDPMDAIMFIRERRKGAINRRQLQFLKSYRRRSQMQRCCIKGCSIM